MSYYKILKPKEFLPERILVEIWELKHPEKIYGVNLNEKRLLSKSSLEKILEEWRELGARLENPMITIQANINEGVFVAYEFKDGREGIPPICQSFTIKYAFNENIRPLHMSYDGFEKIPGHSLVFHSHLNNERLKIELEKTVEIIQDFFNGKGKISTDYQHYLKNIRLIGEELVIDNNLLVSLSTHKNKKG